MEILLQLGPWSLAMGNGVRKERNDLITGGKRKTSPGIGNKLQIQFEEAARTGLCVSHRISVSLGQQHSM